MSARVLMCRSSGHAAFHDCGRKADPAAHLEAKSSGVRLMSSASDPSPAEEKEKAAGSLTQQPKRVSTENKQLRLALDSRYSSMVPGSSSLRRLPKRWVKSILAVWMPDVVDAFAQARIAASMMDKHRALDASLPERTVSLRRRPAIKDSMRNELKESSKVCQLELSIGLHER